MIANAFKMICAIILCIYDFEDLDDFDDYDDFDDMINNQQFPTSFSQPLTSKS